MPTVNEFEIYATCWTEADLQCEECLNTLTCGSQTLTYDALARKVAKRAVKDGWTITPKGPICIECLKEQT